MEPKKFRNPTWQTSTSSQQVATSCGLDWNYSQAERLSIQSRHPRTPAAREGSEKNPERRTDVSKTTERETNYNEDEDFSNMWQPTSERLQVCINMCPETEESELKNTPYSAWLPVWRDTGVLAAAADVLSARSMDMVYIQRARQRLSVLNRCPLDTTLRRSKIPCYY